MRFQLNPHDPHENDENECRRRERKSSAGYQLKTIRSAFSSKTLHRLSFSCGQNVCVFKWKRIRVDGGLGLALKQRRKATRKSPIACVQGIVSMIHCVPNQWIVFIAVSCEFDWSIYSPTSSV